MCLNEHSPFEQVLHASTPVPRALQPQLFIPTVTPDSRCYCQSHFMNEKTVYQGD